MPRIKDLHGTGGLEKACPLSNLQPERWRLAGWLGGVSPLRVSRQMSGVLPGRGRDAPGPACAEHARQLGSESLPPNLMEVKG